MRAFVSSLEIQPAENPANIRVRATTQLVLDDNSVVVFDAYAELDQDATLNSIETAVAAAVRSSSVGYGYGVVPSNRVILPSFVRG